MSIHRLQVEGGFLNGLDIEFSAGLNVLIGERGTGKTSVIELLRYALQAGSLLDGAEARLTERARAALGDGVVRVEAEGPDGPIEVSRSYRDSEPRRVGAIPNVTVVGQTEMESIGYEPRSRLRLLDRYGGGASAVEAQEATSALSETRSLTEQLTQVRHDLARVAQALDELAGVPDDLANAVEAQQRGLESVNATAEEAERLSALQSQVEAARQFLDQIRDAEGVLEANRRLVADASTRWRDSPLAQVDGGTGLAAGALEAMSKAREALSVANAEGERAATLLLELRAAQETSLANLDRETKALRDHLESLQEGLSAAARAVEGLRERAGTRTALLERRVQLEAELRKLAQERQAAYTAVSELRAKRLDRRLDVAASLSRDFGPSIRVRVNGGADRSNFVAAIIEALTGSGLHYNTLGPLLAESMSPLELVEAAEQLNEDAIATAAGLPGTRAAQIAMQLNTSELADLALSPIDDVIELELLDGAEYKPMKILSIGQRCTVVLPVILGAPTTCLILDQPEDNLDNAFLASTIVPGIAARASESQVIIATHNANIPVLGGAKRVLHMGSDGARGFLVSAGGLEASDTRRAITEIMEGGLEAFQRRASFYGVTDE